MPEPSSKAPAAACRAVTFLDGASPETRGGDVFLWTSVDGVRRMPFLAYLDLVEAPHDARYRLVRMSDRDVDAAGEVVQADAEFLRVHVLSHDVPRHDDKTYMAFRSVWHAATGELMPM